MTRRFLAFDFLEALSRIARKQRTAFDARVVAHGLTYPRARALFLLREERCLTQTELAAALDLETATVVRLLDGMEKLGLIRRSAVEGDRRAKHVGLTAHGRTQAALVAGIAGEMSRAVLESVGEEDLRTALGVFRTMSANVEALGRVPADA